MRDSGVHPKSTRWLRWQELKNPRWARGDSMDSGCWARHLRFEPSAQDVILLQQSTRGAFEVGRGRTDRGRNIPGSSSLGVLPAM